MPLPTALEWSKRIKTLVEAPVGDRPGPGGHNHQADPGGLDDFFRRTEDIPDDQIIHGCKGYQNMQAGQGCTAVIINR